MITRLTLRRVISELHILKRLCDLTNLGITLARLPAGGGQSAVTTHMWISQEQPTRLAESTRVLYRLSLKL